MGLAAFLAAFAIAAGGNPSDVVCNPNGLSITGAAGVTRISTRRIELSPPVCAGLLFLEASPQDRALIGAANPKTNIEWLMGAGALVLAHEAQHSAGVVDEGDAECRAVRVLPQLLSQYLSGQGYEVASGYATQYHVQSDPMYRAVC